MEYVQRTLPHDEAKELRGPGRSIHLHATDTAPELNAEWLVELTEDVLVWRRGHEKATVALRGPLTAVLLAFYRRLPLDSAGAGGARRAGAAGVLAGAGDLRVISGALRAPGDTAVARPLCRTRGRATSGVREASAAAARPAAAQAEEHGAATDATRAAAIPAITPVLELAPVSARLESPAAGDGALLAGVSAGAVLLLSEGDGVGLSVSSAGVDGGVRRRRGGRRGRSVLGLAGRGRGGQVGLDVLVHVVAGAYVDAVLGVRRPVLFEGDGGALARSP